MKKPTMKNNYDKDFYRNIASGSSLSAQIVVPFVCDVLNPTSVLEIGCGVGTWSQEFVNRGIADVLAVDGPWVDLQSLYIDSSKFKAHDLREPLNIQRRFDLAVCMEVAEHLPESMANMIVSLLTDHADTVLFAAAVPFQGGTDHINEQPQSYWAALFKEKGYEYYDIVRPEIWNNRSVEIWYRQNIIVYSKNKIDLKSKPILDVIHPEILEYYLSNWKGVLRSIRLLTK